MRVPYSGTLARRAPGHRLRTPRSRLDKFGFDKFALEDVQANRTRFGWPFRTITLDVVPRESEWHLVFETFWFANNLFFSFLGWLCIQPVFEARKWLFRFNKSAGKSGQPVGTVSDTDS